MALLSVGMPRAAAANRHEAGSAAALAAEEKESCTRNLRVIFDAIQAYQFDHKDLPNWLSDLVPDYLSDGNVLICPVCRRTGQTEQPPLADPKLACSYVFEFSPVPIGSITGEPKHTRREWKRRQMGLVGSGVPLVRCRHHNPMLNLAFNGNIYESPPQWELLFTNRVRAAELTVRAIFGPEAIDDPVATPSVSAAGPQAAGPEQGSGSTIELTDFYNSKLQEAWQGKPGDDLSALPEGRQIFGGIAFDVRGIIQLKGKSSSLSRFPAEVKGIPVHRRCQHLYFLHAATVTGLAQEGEQIGSYVLHLPSNQMTLEIPIYYGRSVRDWHQEKVEPGPEKELKVAWKGQNAATKTTGKQIRLFVTTWNLAPGVEIDSVDFVSAMRTTAPFLLAMSFD